MNEIHEYEGTINQFPGNGVMVLIGAPVVHENSCSLNLTEYHCLLPRAVPIGRLQIGGRDCLERAFSEGRLGRVSVWIKYRSDIGGGPESQNTRTRTKGTLVQSEIMVKMG